MQYNDGKIQRKLIFLVVIITIVLVLAIALSNFTYAQEIQVDKKTLYRLTNQTSTTQKANITTGIAVGNEPRAIGVGPITNIVYVANSLSDSVSVINGYDNEVTNIPVGKGPTAIGIDEDPNTDTAYVANARDDTVSVIDQDATKAVVGVTFNITPDNAGHIECDKDKKLFAPLVQQFYLWSGSQCTAIPNQGFEFVSWQKNLGGNSSQVI